MPNHVTNILEFDCGPVEFRRLAESLRSSSLEPLGQVDFNRLIPMPASLDIEAGSRGETGYREYREFMEASEGKTPDERKALEQTYLDRFSEDPEIWELGKQYYENVEKYGCPNWYDWCVSNWNTKWNAYQCVPVAASDRRLEFLTAWSCVPAIVKAISEKAPQIRIGYAWADENIGYNVGKIVVMDGKLLEENIPEGGSKEAYEMAAEILSEDLSDLGFRLTEDGSTYEYAEEEPCLQPPPSSSRGKGGDAR